MLKYQAIILKIPAYLKEELDFKIREDLNIPDTIIEQLWLEIKRKIKNNLFYYY